MSAFSQRSSTTVVVCNLDLESVVVVDSETQLLPIATCAERSCNQSAMSAVPEPTEHMGIDTADAKDENVYSRERIESLMRVERKQGQIAGIGVVFAQSWNDTRACVLDWLISVNSKFAQSDSTLYLAIHVFDRYMANPMARVYGCQLLACVSLWIAAKFHESRIPMIADFRILANYSFKEETMLRCELSVVKTLECDFIVSTPLVFAQRLVKLATAKLRADANKRMLTDTVFFLLEWAMQNWELATGSPLKLATAVLSYAMCATRVLSAKNWDRSFAAQNELMSLSDLLPTIRTLEQWLSRKTRLTASERKWRVSSLQFRRFKMEF